MDDSAEPRIVAEPVEVGDVAGVVRLDLPHEADDRISASGTAGVGRQVQDPLIVFQPRASIDHDSLRDAVWSGHLEELLGEGSAVQHFVVRCGPSHPGRTGGIEEMGVSVDNAGHADPRRRGRHRVASDKLRVAVVGGCGDWGRRYTWAYANHPEAELIALVDTARDRRRSFAERYDIPHQFDSVDELLAWEVPDVVANILPVSAAPDAVIACAEAGVKAVSCEKPMAARLSDADRMVDTCRQRNIPFACGTALWEVHHLQEIGAWVQAGNIGRITSAATDGFLAQGDQVSGLGCVILNFLRFVSGDEADWVEGWTIPEEAAQADEDCAAYGSIGMSGGYVYEARREVPEEGAHKLALFGERGALWTAGGAGTVMMQGTGRDARPVEPAFIDDDRGGPSPGDSTPGDSALPVVDSLMRAARVGREALCSGHDYRQVLEIAAAMKLSAREGNRRVALPLEDRSAQVLPIPYRWHGGDVTGWDVIGREGSPEPY